MTRQTSWLLAAVLLAGSSAHAQEKAKEPVRFAPPVIKKDNAVSPSAKVKPSASVKFTPPVVEKVHTAPPKVRKKPAMPPKDAEEIKVVVVKDTVRSGKDAGKPVKVTPLNMKTDVPPPPPPVPPRKSGN